MKFQSPNMMTVTTETQRSDLNFSKPTNSVLFCFLLAFLTSIKSSFSNSNRNLAEAEMKKRDMVREDVKKQRKKDTIHSFAVDTHKIWKITPIFSDTFEQPSRPGYSKYVK